MVFGSDKYQLPFLDCAQTRLLRPQRLQAVVAILMPFFGRGSPLQRKDYMKKQTFGKKCATFCKNVLGDWSGPKRAFWPTFEPKRQD